MASDLAPLPEPGLRLFPGFTAQKPETFLMKGSRLRGYKPSFLVSHSTASGESGTPFLKIRGKNRAFVTMQAKFLTMDGEEVMRIDKQIHWNGPVEYHELTINDPSSFAYDIKIQNKIQNKFHNMVQNVVHDQGKSILIDGNPVATISRSKPWSISARRDLVHVAPGMDILVALGVTWIRADKQK
ncbi:uncharacterized protein K460DRAFT_423065 [Cucurbitaria berberidis CBS 394.84]|uniref:Uncharacterized protein n=1 Tax=Cucurbitaria berberidis CBS 394.84 TaxID=1168544 RepID=A0A9P4LDY4_9PLEO|nr:uncharacterized protein K460DRAFT_423065 [Cucurbitaria berberidis CBS 394.84]KAF1850579.1 hypothetical protein K460DRAFT_423065 [Cucurbitaria berberidis CBS 394.84]